MTDYINDKYAYTAKESIAIKSYMIIGLLVFLLMMVAGVVMKAIQGGIVQLPPDLFYQILTVHGAGMVGAAGLASSGVMWYFLRRYVVLSANALFANLALFLIGVVLILGSVFIGKFAGAWTFLYPLPSKSMGIWSPEAAITFLVGLLLIGAGFLIYYIDIGIAIVKKYGSIANALGIYVLFGKSELDKNHPTTVVASTMVLIVNFIGTAVGAVVLILSIVNIFEPDFVLDALLIKNLIYFFGHVFINATIYSAVTAVYELLPHYTGRPWKVSKPFYAAWVAASFMVMAVYPHHLLMDYAMPNWMLIMGQIMSYCSGIPVLAVTAYGALTIIHKSGIKWTIAPVLLIISMFGWAAGVIPAVIDGMIGVNKIMHNTLWVPGHFHFYLIVGMLPMILGFGFYLVNDSIDEKNKGEGNGGVYLFLVGALGLISSFLYGGFISIPRRWAEHYESWQLTSVVGFSFALLILLSFTFMAYKIIVKLPKVRFN